MSVGRRKLSIEVDYEDSFDVFRQRGQASRERSAIGQSSMIPNAIQDNNSPKHRFDDSLSVDRENSSEHLGALSDLATPEELVEKSIDPSDGSFETSISA